MSEDKKLPQELNLPNMLSVREALDSPGKHEVAGLFQQIDLNLSPYSAFISLLLGTLLIRFLLVREDNLRGHRYLFQIASGRDLGYHLVLLFHNHRFRISYGSITLFIYTHSTKLIFVVSCNKSFSLLRIILVNWIYEILSDFFCYKLVTVFNGQTF